MAPGETFEVRLAIYDLSRGMARALSAQFLGVPLELIPHTAIVVYGREYFFGAGIQAEPPAAFRRSVQLFPLQELPLGRSAVPQAAFEAWCAAEAASGRFAAAAYDLFHRNCNHFSHAAALQGLRLARGVPDEVLDVPRRVLASPMGQLLVPVLRDLQVTRADGAEAVHAPIGGAAGVAAAPVRPATASVQIAAATDNPWATVATGGESDTLVAASNAANENTRTDVATPLLDSFTAPLLSQETTMLRLCAGKLAPLARDETDRLHLEEASLILSRHGGDRTEGVSEPVMESCCRVIERSLQESTSVSFALLFLRILVLWNGIVKENGALECMERCLDLVFAALISDASSLTTPTARAAAWLIAANTLGSPSRNALEILSGASSRLQHLVDAATRDAADDDGPALPVRQAACAFLYNAALVVGATADRDEDGLSDLTTAVLCSSFAVGDEKDPVCRLRRLLAMGRLLKPTEGEAASAAARSLLTEVGIVDILSSIVTEDAPDKKGHEQCRVLASELLQLLSD